MIRYINISRSYYLFILVPRYGYRDSPRIAKKFEFTYPGTTSLFSPGVTSSHSGSGHSVYGTGPGQQYNYNRSTGGGRLSLSGCDNSKQSGESYSLDAVTSSTTGSGSSSLTATLPQSHTRYRNKIYYYKYIVYIYIYIYIYI